MFNKLKQFKDIREKAKELQAAMAAETAEGVSGWGNKVKVVVNGTQQIVSVSIDPSAMDDRAKLETMIKEAANDAMQNVQKLMGSKMRDMGGMDLAKELGDMMGE